MKMESSKAQMREVNRSLHRAKAAEVERVSRRDTRRFCNKKADDAKQAAIRRDQRTLFRMAKDLREIRNWCIGQIKDLNSNKVSYERKKVERWREFFSNFMNCDEPASTLTSQFPRENSRWI